MTRLRFHRDDYKESPRRSESSEKVVRCWYDGRVVYDAETAVADESCLGIIAERIVLRRLLGIDGGEKKHVPYVLDAKPFGVDGPKCSELLLSDVFVAMAFVPLTPPDSRGRPVLARLYCVSGLSKRYTLSSLYAGIVSDGGRCSWFLTGLPDEKLDAAIDGRSWLLAAELLKHVATKMDVATARNLATKFIVTGGVQNGLITKVEMGRKGELALRYAFRDFKWIIPKENGMDNVPKRKIEKPATLDEAYSLIESMQNVATRSMFKAIRRADIDEVRVQYEKNGADIYARKSDTNLMPIQIVEQEIQQEIKKLREVANPSADKDARVALMSETRMERLQTIKHFLQSEGADCPLMFYTLAKIGARDSISKIANTYPINAVDGNGLTAVDWALNVGDLDGAELLHACGCNCNPHYEQNERLVSAITYFSDDSTDRCDYEKHNRAINLIVQAIKFGLSYETEVALTKLRDLDGDWRLCSLFAAAVRYLNYGIMEECLKCGADANKEVTYGRWESPPECGRVFCICEKGTPCQIVKKSNYPQERQNKILRLLKDYGATEA